MTNNEFDFVTDVNLKWARSLSRLNKLDTIVIHHSASDGSTIQSIHAYHRSEGHAGCDYNYVIARDGVIYKGRGLIYEGGHVRNDWTRNLNSHSCGICIVGAIHKHAPTDAQVAAAKKLISAILALGGKAVGGVPIKITAIYGHKEVPYYPNGGKLSSSNYPTVCPGQYMPLTSFKALLTGQGNGAADTNTGTESGGVDLPAMYAYAGASGVNVRSGPGTGYAVTGKLSAGEQCIVLSDSNGWARAILLNQSPVMVGWCIDTYLEEKDESDPPALYTYSGGSFVNLRIGPGTLFKVIGKVESTDNVLVLRRLNGWAEVIKYDDTPVLRGWCTDTYLRRV